MRTGRLSPHIAIAAALLVGFAQLLTPAHPSMAREFTAEIAFSRNYNVFIADPSGGNVQAITTRGTGPKGITYPWYEWSPDGKYLLLLRAHLSANSATLLLLDRSGGVLRTLARVPAPSDFWPSWAVDRDQISFVASSTGVHNTIDVVHTVDAITVNGRRRVLLSYRNREGCGGGTSSPAEARYWTETGYQGMNSALAWSVSRGVAAYQRGCGGGVNITDLNAHRTRSFPSWNEPTISSGGQLAIVNHTPGPSPIPGGAESILVVDSRTGAVRSRIGSGELPLWSHNGGSLYFVRRAPGALLRGRDLAGNRVELQTFRSAIYQSRSDGSHLTRLASEDAFGFGPLSLLPSGGSLVFSRVSNDWAIWNHRQGSVLPMRDGTAPSRLLPAVTIQRLDPGKPVRTILRNAGRPAVEP